MTNPLDLTFLEQAAYLNDKEIADGIHAFWALRPSLLHNMLMRQ